MQIHTDVKIENDLMTAARLQRAVLPDGPKLPYLSSAIVYRPCGVISGDVYNFQLNREGEISVFLGDATGHGVTAALMTMMVHLSLENFPGNLPTDEILRRLNTMVARHNTGLAIASQLFRLSPGGLLRVAHAGLPSLIILPACGDAPVIFHQGGCPVGMFSEEMVPYVEETRQLRPGDRLLACTDGLIEWQNSDGISFGYERLMQLGNDLRGYSIEHLPKAIMQGVLEFTGEDINHDDVTLLCFEYSGAH